MPAKRQGQPADAAGEKKQKAAKRPMALHPSSSILLVSPTNQVLLLRRVQTSSSFASAHVFPGGNLSSFHDGELTAVGGPAMHEDGSAYRLAVVRETFEESGILLAKKAGQNRERGLLHVPDEVREAGRREVHANRVRFTEWLKSVGGEPDVENLIPFTRWITPPGVGKRFTTQMYLYMLPLSAQALKAVPDPDLLHQETMIPTPTHDGGLEHTAAAFEDASVWLERANKGDVILFPPQYYLLHLVSEFLRPSASASPPEDYQSQRDALVAFLNRTPTSKQERGEGKRRQEDDIPWSEKVMSPTMLSMRRGDGRLVLGLDKPGPELRETARGGDWDRVVLVHFRKEGPRDVEVRWREEVLREGREQGEDAKL
ncbi:Nucleoside diphosphate-linked moiety X motif 19, mitochondrial [Madurella mycetomatis]|uniref:Nucleoside diphosphate-linked moiety X motif 19, mitochondrial n=1 Tax=Madurella mycetomatis TaxID=100816 RepID=A0A175WAY9_9PEZI|nr:Nucleoside diphosphate-linked moiety X motif 19, mitochondrial [Madurella mycetomatis]